VATVYPKLVDLCGWITVWLAVAVGVVSVAGAASILQASSQAAQEQAREQLHLVGHILIPQRSGVIPFFLCLLLAIGVGYFGYSMTQHSVERRISKIAPGSPASGSRLDGSEGDSRPSSADTSR
jgi:type VI protein secretion system component VasF